MKSKFSKLLAISILSIVPAVTSLILVQENNVNIVESKNERDTIEVIKLTDENSFNYSSISSTKDEHLNTNISQRSKVSSRELNDSDKGKLYIGIAIGGSFAVIFIGLSVWFVLKRVKRKKRIKRQSL